MRKLVSVFTLVALCLLIVSCGKQQKKYVIGVSQCSEDSWRNKLQQELIAATYCHEGIELKFSQARDNDRLQGEQINEMVDEGIDLLIVSPNSMGQLNASIERAYDKGIPVILFDRKTGSDKYTAFMGADNYVIGQNMGSLIAMQLNGKGKIVAIGGLEQSSPAQERHRGFTDAIAKYPQIEIVGYRKGDWTEESGKKAMQEILDEYKGDIDCVFGENDRMAVGARSVMEKAHRDSGVKFYGVDALTSPDGGMQLVDEGKLDASAIYPTHGDELLELAIDILNGNEFQRENMMKSAIVTPENVKVMMLESQEKDNLAANLIQLCQRIDTTLVVLQNQKLLLWTLLGVVLVLLIFISIIYKFNMQLQQRNNTIRQQRDEITQQRDELAKQKETVERQRDELEEQRDQLIEVSMGTTDSLKDESIEDYEQGMPFLKKFTEYVKDHISDTELSVETIGRELGYSRVQLYRKIKGVTGHSPVELLRLTRLERAQRLLQETNYTVAEVGYKVGFSSPSYFNKCYKDQYGISPGEAQKA